MKGMLCDNCKHLHHMYPDWTSPYGEYACLKLECDLYGENVTECEHFAPTESTQAKPEAEPGVTGGTHD